MTTDVEPIELTFIEDYDDEHNHLLSIKVSADLADVIKKIKDIASENKLEIFKEAWYSKYNKYVVYDNIPFGKEGFYYCASFKYDDVNEKRFAFTKNILGAWIKKVNQLNKLLAITE